MFSVFVFGLGVSSIKMFAIILSFCMIAAVFVMTIAIFSAIMWWNAFGFNGCGGVFNQSIQDIIDFIRNRWLLSIIL